MNSNDATPMHTADDATLRSIAADADAHADMRRCATYLLQSRADRAAGRPGLAWVSERAAVSAYRRVAAALDSRAA